MSENIFKEIYSKVLSLFKQTEKVDENAKDVAKNRLRVVLMQDRTNLTPELLQRMRKELIELLSKYVEMDKEALELNFDQEGDQMALMLSIPVIRAKDEAEIEKALAEKEKSEDDSEDESEDIDENSDNDADEDSDKDSEDKTEENSENEETSEDEPEKTEDSEAIEEKEETEEVSETENNSSDEDDKTEKKPSSKKEEK
jgi:cell division topological specificity factor